MKNTKYILLVIGILGLAAGVYAIVTAKGPSEYLLGLICGASLVFGYFELNKHSHSKE
ncbi:hypothetical protein [Roseivirga sp. E12]|uniref:hypothetical protein n=1 Tax=Roseivirga sp. E12 TaxID=2819237 RepID=UPI001ABCD0F2|nr:hypothetical protein [Roseivirga sp. E12]MBO3700627.1 hypothetical protein [Roseivirga sp. E12]